MQALLFAPGHARSLRMTGRESSARLAAWVRARIAERPGEARSTGVRRIELPASEPNACVAALSERLAIGWLPPANALVEPIADRIQRGEAERPRLPGPKSLRDPIRANESLRGERTMELRIETGQLRRQTIYPRWLVVASPPGALLRTIALGLLLPAPFAGIVRALRDLVHAHSEHRRRAVVVEPHGCAAAGSPPRFATRARMSRPLHPPMPQRLRGRLGRGGWLPTSQGRRGAPLRTRPQARGDPTPA